MERLAAVGAIMFPLIAAEQPDVFFPHYVPGCEAGCAVWSEVVGAATLFASSSVPANAADTCAMPGRNTGDANGAVNTSAAGPWCYCKGSNAEATGAATYCTPQQYIPEQINLQYAAADTLVAGFVTYEPVQPVRMAQATLVVAGSAAAPTMLTGVSHWLAFTPPGDVANTTAAARNYTMHFVKFTGLKPGTHYTYTVKSGAE
jgi:hypothetical protein